MSLTGALWVVGMFVAFAGLIAWAFWNSSAARLKRAMRDMPRTTVAAAPRRALVKLVGRVRLSGQPLRAPVTGRPCTFYHVRIVRSRRDWDEDAFGRSRLETRWVVVHDDVERSSFLLEDESGVAKVVLDAPEVLILRAETAGAGLPRPLTPELRAYLDGRGLTSLRAHSLRFEERILAEGDQVAVLGWTSVEAGEGPGEPVMRILLSDTPTAPVRIATIDAL